MTCKFKISNDVFCKRTARGDFCRFHTPLGSGKRISDHRYYVSLNALLAKGDYDFRGFIFPKNLDVRNYSISEKINLASSTFENINLYKTDFGSHVYIVGSNFNGEINVRECSFDNLDVSSSTFLGDVNLIGIKTKSRFDAGYCNFKSHFNMHGIIYGLANFSYSYFYSRTVFSWYRAEHFSTSFHAERYISSGSPVFFFIGGNNVSWFIKILNVILLVIQKSFSFIKENLSIFRKKSLVVLEKISDFRKSKWLKFRRRFPYQKEGLTEIPLFCGEANLINVVFDKPKLVSFINVDLSNVSFDATDIRGVSFLNCHWFQKPLNRNGLVHEHKYNLTDYHERKYWLPRIESGGRNIRQALEDNRDYHLANDFFISEMEAKRQQLSFFKRNFFSILAWYRALSIYGTSPLTCLKFIFLVSALHSAILLEYVGFNFTPIFDLISRPTVFPTITDLFEAFLSLISSFGKSLIHSLQIMTLQRNKIISDVEFPYWVEIVNFVAAILGPVLTILFGLCVRTRIKRF